jgi:hypothetical protein
MHNIPIRAPVRNSEFIDIILKMHSTLFCNYAAELQNSKCNRELDTTITNRSAEKGNILDFQLLHTLQLPNKQCIVELL